MKNLLDLDRYPLDQAGSRGWSGLVAAAREDLERHGMFNLPGFLRTSVLEAAVAELQPVFDTAAFRHSRLHNIYFKPEIDGLSPDHPALGQSETSHRTICEDQMTDMILARLYRWEPFAEFLAATMDKPALYTMDDPLAGVNAMRYADGEALGWHFDRSEFTTTLLLQAPQEGGVFQYRTGLRTAADPNYEGVARLLAGQDPELQELRLTAGTLNVFRGKNTAHRVTPVKGGTPRIIGVFSFFDRPGARFSEEERRGFYGRTR